MRSAIFFAIIGKRGEPFFDNYKRKRPVEYEADFFAFNFFNNDGGNGIVDGRLHIFDDLFAPSDNEDADNKLQAFVECLNNEDREVIKSLFAKNKVAEISNFDDSIEELLLYYDGEYISVERHSTGVEEDKDSGIERKWYNMSYDVTTDTQIYRMAFYWCAKDTGDKGNVGIESFYVIKAADDSNYPQYTYRGDGLWTIGINIGKTHEVDEIG